MSAYDYPLPPSLQNVPAIRRIYPAPYRREIKREHPSWNHLRKYVRNEYVRQHPGTPAAVTFYVKHGGSIRVAFRAVWDRFGIPAWRQRRLECIVEHEGGFDVMDRWYGGSVGWQNGRFAGTDTVVNPGQTRPYHARLTHPEVLDTVVTWRTFKILTNPYDAARTMYLVGDSAYVTLGMCS